MNLNFRKTALLAGICSVFSLGYAPQLFAVSSTDTVEAVQQTKKITGVVSDAMINIVYIKIFSFRKILNFGNCCCRFLYSMF